MTCTFKCTSRPGIYTLSLHDALPIFGTGDLSELALGWCTYGVGDHMSHYAVNASVPKTDRKSTRLNSSHVSISYAVFCLKKKTHLKRAGKKVLVLERRHVSVVAAVTV